MPPHAIAAIGQAAAPQADFLYQLGAFGVAMVVGYWLLGRSDKQIERERADAALEVNRIVAQLEAERAAHSETRMQLFAELRKRDKGTP